MIPGYRNRGWSRVLRVFALGCAWQWRWRMQQTAPQAPDGASTVVCCPDDRGALR